MKRKDQKNNLYKYLCSLGNLTIAWRKARIGKTKIPEVVNFDKNIERNLLTLHKELISRTYKPLPLTNFILRDPKTRKISKADFRDRVVHHALINVIGKTFEKTFIYDSCANQKNKGTLLAVQRFILFRRKVTLNYRVPAFCLKADIKQYFPNINHEILISIIRRKIKDEDVIWLIQQIINIRSETNKGLTKWLPCKKGMPLGNYTSQFFANVYLDELDQFVKHKLKAKYYIRYVDDFVIFHKSKKQLEKWKEEISIFLKDKLKLQLHPDKSKIIPLSKGVDFVGFRNFAHFSLLRKRNIRKMKQKINAYKNSRIWFNQLMSSYQGWQGYAMWANTHKLREKVKREIVCALWDKI